MKSIFLSFFLSLLLSACGGGSSIISPANAQISQPLVFEQISCIVRPDANGRWYIQNDGDHAPLGCDLTLQQSDSEIRVFFKNNYSHVGSVQVSSDDDFNVIVQGFANAGLNSVNISVYANGQKINPSEVYNHIPLGGGNFWISATMARSA